MFWIKTKKMYTPITMYPSFFYKVGFMDMLSLKTTLKEIKFIVRGLFPLLVYDARLFIMYMYLCKRIAHVNLFILLMYEK